MPSFTIKTRKASPLSSPYARYRGFNPGSSVLAKGLQPTRGGRVLTCDIIHERDVALTMRDGVRLYADVFRPADASGPVPAIVNWAPYGKGGTGRYFLEDGKAYPNRLGIPRKATSGLQSWEANDPAYWCAKGYAVVQVDARGAFDSEGILAFFGSQEGRDGHDAIEAIAVLPWCSGKVGMAGNSWLGLCQWQIAAQRPPHLAAIAPWEGMSDKYRDFFVRGGIPEGHHLADMLTENFYGRGEVEDVLAMLEDHPILDEYWRDKAPPVEVIDIPAYVVASYTNLLHTNGTFRAWKRLACPRWLRIHNTLEWIDFYDEGYSADLVRFFDRYLKGIENGWEDTPSVRMAVLDPGHHDIVDRAESAFPPPAARPMTLHADFGSRTLEREPSSNAASAHYDLQSNSPHLDLIHTFDHNCEIVGWPLLRLWLEIDGHDDADVYVQLQKLDRKGRILRHQMVDLGLPGARRWMPWLFDRGVTKLRGLFYNGTEGKIRASRRGLDPRAPGELSELALDSSTPVPQGQPFELEIPFWAVAMRWHAGEQLRLRISGIPLVPMRTPEMMDYPPDPLQQGRRHIFHSGGNFASSLSFLATEFQG